MIIEKKIWPVFFEKIIKGEKRFELRLADFKCQPDDVLILKEWDPISKKYTGRKIKKSVDYVTRTKDLKFWDRDEIDKYGFQIIQFKNNS